MTEMIDIDELVVDGVVTRPDLYNKILGYHLSAQIRRHIFWYAFRHYRGKDIYVVKLIRSGALSVQEIEDDHAAWKQSRLARTG